MNHLNKLILLSIFSISLQGCVAVAGGTAAVAGAPLIYDKRPIQQIMQDENISYQISQALNRDKLISTRCHIVISTFHNIVLLAGQAPTNALRQRALKIAKKISGIVKFYNKITIAKPTSALTRTTDAWITTKVKARLIGQDNLKSGQFKVVTENSVVYLMGIVHRDQSVLAVKAIRDTKGVNKVITIFEYTNPNININHQLT